MFGVKKVMFTGSMGSYAVTQETVVMEETKQKPMLIYGVTKVFGELLGLYYQRKFGTDFRGIRFPQLIGPNVKTFGFGQYNPWLIEAAVKGEPFDVWAPEETVLPLLYIKDAVRSLVMLYDADESRLATQGLQYKTDNAAADGERLSMLSRGTTPTHESTSSLIPMRLPLSRQSRGLSRGMPRNRNGDGAQRTPSKIR